MTTLRKATLETMRSPSLLSFLERESSRNYFHFSLYKRTRHYMIGSENCVEEAQLLVLFQWLWKQLKESNDQLTFSAPSKGTSPRRYDRRFLQTTHKQ